jgi:hypothetical protein
MPSYRIRDPVVAEKAFEQWNKTRTGAFTTFGINQVSWLRIPANDSIWKQLEDPAAGKNTPHVELAYDVRVVCLFYVLSRTHNVHRKQNSAGFTGLSGFFVGAGLGMPTPLSSAY